MKSFYSVLQFKITALPTPISFETSFATHPARTAAKKIHRRKFLFVSHPQECAQIILPPFISLLCVG